MQYQQPRYAITQTETQQAVGQTLYRMFGNNLTLYRDDDTPTTVMSDDVKQVRILSGQNERQKISKYILQYGLPSRGKGFFFRGYRLRRLPANFGYWYGELKALMIRNTGLEQLPDSIGSMVSLTFLDISHNNVSDLPRSLRALTNLKRFFARGNRGIRTLPGTIGNMGELTDLVFSDCSITRIEQGFPGAANQLRILNLEQNHLRVQQVPWDALSHLPSLRILNLSHNAFSSTLTNRGTIGFSGSFPSLEKLNLSFTFVEELPADLFRIRSLKILVLSGNPLTSIPPEITNLTSLEELYLDRLNRVDTLPVGLRLMPNLRIFDAALSAFVEHDNLNYRQIRAATASRRNQSEATG